MQHCRMYAKGLLNGLNKMWSLNTYELKGEVSFCNSLTGSLTTQVVLNTGGLTSKLHFIPVA